MTSDSVYRDYPSSSCYRYLEHPDAVRTNPAALRGGVRSAECPNNDRVARVRRLRLLRCSESTMLRRSPAKPAALNVGRSVLFGTGTNHVLTGGRLTGRALTRTESSGCHMIVEGRCGRDCCGCCGRRSCCGCDCCGCSCCGRSCCGRSCCGRSCCGCDCCGCDCCGCDCCGCCGCRNDVSEGGDFRFRFD